MFILGIDVSKKKFDSTLIDQETKDHYKELSNNPKGYQKLSQWLSRHKVKELHVCLEATNIYWEELAFYLHQEGYQVSVVNPMRIRGFATSQLRRNKTDKLDSNVIATFCQQTKPKLWQPPQPHQRQLQALVRHQQSLKKSLTQHKNRLQVTREPLVQDSLLLIIQTLEAQLSTMEEQIQALIQQHPDLKEQQRLLVSIKGFGVKTATVIMAEMYDLAHYDHARAAAADAGLTPSHHTSGSSVRKRPKLSKMGKAAVRGVLYWPAITAIQHNPIIRAFAERLRAKGKSNKVIIAAAMRKLLHLAYGVLKHQRPFDPDYVNTPSPSSP